MTFRPPSRFRTRSLLLLLLTAVAPTAWAQALSPLDGPDFGTRSIGVVQIPLRVSGGDGTYAWTLVGGALPPGVSLRTDGPPWFPSDYSAGLIGVATTPGPYAFTLRVTSAAETLDVDYTVEISPLVVTTFWNLGDAFVGTPFSRTLTAANNAGPLTWTLEGGLPPGLSLSPDGEVWGTPTTAGFYNFSFTVSDGVDTVWRDANVSVYDIEITTAGELPNATQNGAYTALIEADGGTPPYIFTANFLPTGLVLDPSGAISGTADTGPGKWGFTATVTDSNHVSYSKQMAIVVVGAPKALPSIGADFESATLGQPFARNVWVFAGGTAPFTWTATGLPPGLSIRWGSGATFSWTSPGDLEISGTPTALGPFDVEFTVTDADGKTATNTFPLHVSPLLNDTFATPSGTIFTSYSGRLRFIGGTLPYTAVQTGGRLPAGLTFNPGTFQISGTPIETGGFGIQLEVGDAAGASLQTSHFMWVDGDGTTIAINNGGDLGSVTRGDFYSNQLSACCLPSYEWSLQGGTLPPGLSLSPAGLLSGTPTTDGAYSFLIRVEDPTNPPNFAQRQFTMVVSPLSLQGSYWLANGFVGTVYSATFSATGGTGSLTWTVARGHYLPPGLTLAANGTLFGTPSASGQFTFMVSVRDTAGHEMTRWFAVNIYAAGTHPPLNLPIGPDLGSWVVGSVFLYLEATGGLPPYQYSLTPGAPAIPGMRVQDGPPLPQWFPADVTGGFMGVITVPGDYNTSIRVTDSTGDHFDRAVTITVSPLRVLADWNPPKATLGEPYSFTFVPHGGSGNYSWVGNNLPPGLTLDGAGQLSGTPTVAGNHFVDFVLTDLTTGDVAWEGYPIVVDPFAITAGVLPSGAVGTPYSYAFTANCGGPCTWTRGGGVPFGLTLNSTTGVLSGTPTSSANSFFTIQASGPAGSVRKVVSLWIASTFVRPLAISIPAMNDTEVGGASLIPLVAQGGTPPHAWSVVGGALPPGVSLRGPGEPVSANAAPGFSYLAGRPTQVGTYNFTLAVADSVGTTTTSTFSWRISALNWQYFSLPLDPGAPLVYNTPYTQPLLVVGGSGIYSWSSGPMPPGLSLDPLTGIVSGTPSNTGFFDTRVAVGDTDGNGLAQNVNFSIAGPTSTVIFFGAGPNLGIFNQGFGQTRNLSPFGGTPPYTVTALTALPPGFALLSDASLPPFSTPGSFLLSGIPLSTGTFDFTLRAQDSVGNIGVTTFTVSVVALTQFSPSALADGSVGMSYLQSVVVFTDGPPAVWSVGAGSVLPPGLLLSPGGVITGTPTLPGLYSFTLAATHASGATLPFNFTVRISRLAIIDAPVLPAAISGVPYSHTFTAIGSGSTIVWSATAVPFGFSLSPTGTLSGTTTSAGAAFSLVVTATDGLLPVTRRFVLFARTPNPGQLTFQPLSAALGVVTRGQSVIFNLNPSLGVPPYTWVVAAGSSLPPGLSLLSGSTLPPNRVPASTVLAGVPTTVGDYAFDLIATDSVGSQVRRTFTLRVSSMGILQSSGATVRVGTPHFAQFTAVGGTPPYTFSLSPTSLGQDALPPGLTLSADGLLSGTTTSTGFYSFFLRVLDAAGATFVRGMDLEVTNSFGLTVFSGNPVDGSVGGGRSEELFNNGSSTYSWSLVSGSLPPGMALLPATGSNPARVAGQPNTPGIHIYTLRGTDDANPANFAEHQFTFRIAPLHVVAPPVRLLGLPDLPAGHAGEPYSFTLKVAGGTPPYTFSETPFAPLPAGLTLSPAGLLSGTPLSVGVYGISPIISDSAGATLNGPGMRLVVTPSGVASPLTTSVSVQPLFDASVGAPYSLVLDTPFSSLSRGGVAPYSWSLAAGSLPPGIELMAGGNGVPTQLGGVPSAAGTYAFSLTVSDSSGQTATVPVSLKVSTVALSPESVPPGAVGSAYAVSLVPSGGTPPYTVELDPGRDLPPGLTLAPSGVLSGTPTHAGNYFMAIAAIDSAGATVYKPYRITVDNAAGEAPALGLAPRPIQIHWEQGSPAPAPIPVAVTTTSGALPFTLAVSGLAGASLSSTSGITPASVNLDVDVSSLAPGTHVGVLGGSAPESANLVDSVPVVVTVTPPPACEYSLNPASGSVPAAGGTGSFDVATGPSCAWTAVSSSPWITVTSGGSGTGPGGVSYSVTPSGAASQRDGTITVNGQEYTVTQFGSDCSFAIGPLTLGAPAAGGTAFIAVTASDSTCAWTATGLAAMPAGGTGSGGVTVTVPPNASPASQILTAVIAGQTLTVTQAGVGCTVSLSPDEASSPAAGGEGSVVVTTAPGCPFDTVPGPSWIAVTSGGSGVGSGTLVYSVEPNSTTIARSGSLTIGGQSFHVDQDALPCSVTIDTSGLGSPYGPAGGAGLIAVTTNGSNCAWTASSGDSWASVTAASGTGNATIGVTVLSNASSASPRSTDLTIAGQTVTILQAGTACIYSLQSAAGTVPASGGAGAVGVVAPNVCSWTAATNDPSWLAISSAGGGGTSSVSFVALANPTASPRTGTLTIAGLTYTVTQAAAPCSYTLGVASPTTVSSDGVTGETFGFSTTASGCSPAAVSYVGWITVGTTFSGTAGVVTYTVSPNPATTTRVGTIQVGDRTFEVRQSGGACGYSLGSYGGLFGHLGGAGNVFGSPTGLGCIPATGTDQPSFITLDPLIGPVTNIFTQGYQVSPYVSLTISVRRARITFGGQIFTVKQTSW